MSLDTSSPLSVLYDIRDEYQVLYKKSRTAEQRVYYSGALEAINKAIEKT